MNGDLPDVEVYSDEDIRKIIDLYKKSRTRDKIRYDKRKTDPTYMEQNRQRSKAHYIKFKDVKKNQYENNKDFRRHRSLFNYYRLNNRVGDFISKYPDRVEFLKEHGVPMPSLS